jgi:hypothetical protein
VGFFPVEIIEQFGPEGVLREVANRIPGQFLANHGLL